MDVFKAHTLFSPILLHRSPTLTFPGNPTLTWRPKYDLFLYAMHLGGQSVSIDAMSAGCPQFSTMDGWNSPAPQHCALPSRLYCVVQASAEVDRPQGGPYLRGKNDGSLKAPREASKLMDADLYWCINRRPGVVTVLAFASEVGHSSGSVNGRGGVYF